MANGLPLQESRSWLAGSLNVNNGANVAINSTALLAVFRGSKNRSFWKNMGWASESKVKLAGRSESEKGKLVTEKNGAEARETGNRCSGEFSVTSGEARLGVGMACGGKEAGL